MNPKKNSRFVAADIIARWLKEKQFPDRNLERVRDDRAFVTELVYGVIRNRRALEWLSERHVRERPQPFAEALLYVGIYQLMYMDNVEEYAAINETVEAAKGPQAGQGYVRLLNAVLRKIQRDQDSLKEQLARQPLGIRLSHPDYVLKRWTKQFGEKDARQLCEWNNTPAETIIRVEKNRIEPDNFVAEAAAQGIELEPHTFSTRERFYTVPRGVAVPKIPGYKEGWFTVQDPATCTAVDLLAPFPGESILDACAAPGGKTAIIASRLKGHGELVAMDLHDDRIAVLKENMERLGLDWVEIVKGDACEAAETFKNHSFDAILLDVPCMNTGVFRRRVDAKWRVRMERMKAINKVQFQILTECSKLLNKGGRMVYSTCSLEPEENESLVGRWVKENPGFRLGKAKKILPHKHLTDGAYAAVIYKD